MISFYQIFLEGLFLIVIVKSDMDISTYASHKHFPVIPNHLRCNCGNRNQNLFYRHGYYERNAIVNGTTYRVYIPRLKCLCCLKTISLLPDLLVPYFQYTLLSLLERIRLLLDKKTTDTSRQLNSFLLKRFFRYSNWIYSFFVDRGISIDIPCDKIKDAKKYLNRIRDFGESSFLRESLGHLSTYFLAR